MYELYVDRVDICSKSNKSLKCRGAVLVGCAAQRSPAVSLAGTWTHVVGYKLPNSCWIVCFGCAMQGVAVSIFHVLIGSSVQ
jgi:hypothetical protein